jgi:predicted Zn-dependent protease with MMP-like domain
VTVGDVVRSTLDELPPEERAVVAGVSIRAKAFPDDEDLARGCYPDQQAAFWGVGRELGRQGATALPHPGPAAGEITLFLANLAPLTAVRLRVALLHELGHALGLEEAEIRARGLYLEGETACC